MSVKNCYIGIDLGTSSLKLILIDKDGNIIDSVTEKYSLECPNPGWKEIDQRKWIASLISGVKKLVLGKQDIRVCAIGVSGQMHTLVIVDKQGGYIRPAIMWNDMRTKEMLPKLREVLHGFPDGEYLERTVSIGSPFANLFWLKQNEPENYKAIGKFMIATDYVTFCLTGNFVTDYCCASTSCLYDIKNKKWLDECADFLELPRDVYPRVQGSGIIAGGLTLQMAKDMGLCEGIPVLTATGDNTASGISTGSIAGGYPVLSFGTSGVVLLHSDKDWSDKCGKRILFSFDGKTFHNMLQGTVQSNGSAINWWIKKVLGEKDFGSIDSLVNIEAEKENKVLFYPHLAGDKTMYADPELRGGFIGLSDNETKSALTYSVLEGICFGFRELSENMNANLKSVGCVKVVGGGTNSSVWMQILANVLDVTVERLDGPMGAGLGVAALAAYVETGGTDWSQICCNVVKVSDRFIPDREMVDICNKKYEAYRRIHDGFKYIATGILPG